MDGGRKTPSENPARRFNSTASLWLSHLSPQGDLTARCRGIGESIDETAAGKHRLERDPQVGRHRALGQLFVDLRHVDFLVLSKFDLEPLRRRFQLFQFGR
jgi:hypothetical protein